MYFLSIIKKLNIFKRKKTKPPKQPIQEQLQTTIMDNFVDRVTMNVIQEGLAKNENVVCSPMSIELVLRMLAAGAKNRTLDDLLKALGCVSVGDLDTGVRKLSRVMETSDDDNQDEILKVSSANALWLDKRFGINDVFQKVLRDVCSAEVRALDFVNQADQVVKLVNTWAEQQTNGLIKQLITTQDINVYTRVLLTNALHFNGTWAQPFCTEYTIDSDFTLVNGDKVPVPFMNQCCKYYDYGTFGEDCQVLKLPFKRAASSSKKTSFSMYIFLPDEFDGLPRLVKNIDISRVEFRSVEVIELSIPKFRVESHVSLRECMKQLGLRLPFDENCKDLSGIIDEDVAEPFYISNIVQKCHVETNEGVTEAGSVTRGEVLTAAASPSQEMVNFVADHPFVYIIREDVSSVELFVGTMLDPK